MPVRNILRWLNENFLSSSLKMAKWTLRQLGTYQWLFHFILGMNSYLLWCVAWCFSYWRFNFYIDILVLIHFMSYCIILICRSFSDDDSHYSDVIMSAMASRITGTYIVCSIVGSGTDQGKHESSASLAFVRGSHRWSVNSAHKRPVTRKMLPFDDVIMS